jgi:phage regulator Rha-like protein
MKRSYGRTSPLPLHDCALKMKPTKRIKNIEKLIYIIRDNKVMLDSDLAELYGVETRVLKQAVRRNKKRFPDDFIFELTREEIMRISQIVTSSKIKYSKSVHAFTEQGVAMLSSVLNSERAIEVNIEIMRAFVRVREMLGAQRELASKLKELENSIQDHDEQIQTIFEAIRQLMTPSEKPKKKIGFQIKEPKAKYGKRRK